MLAAAAGSGWRVEVEWGGEGEARGSGSWQVPHRAPAYEIAWSPFGPADTLAAIEHAVAIYGIPYSLLHCTVKGESAGTFEPGIVGDNGHSFGVAQLYDRGQLPRFQGFYGLVGEYGEPTWANPYYEVDYMAWYWWRYGEASFFSQWNAACWE